MVTWLVMDWPLDKYILGINSLWVWVTSTGDYRELQLWECVGGIMVSRRKERREDE